jgi:GH18 family chitinase
VATLSENLDWIAVMTYDYHGQWDKITGHLAPMYPHPDDIDVTFNAVSHQVLYSDVCHHHSLLYPPAADAGCGK